MIASRGNMDMSKICSRLGHEKVIFLDFETAKIVDNEPGIPIQIGLLLCSNFGKNSYRVAQYVHQKTYEPEGDIITTASPSGEIRISIADLTGITSEHLRGEEWAEQRTTEEKIVKAMHLTDSLIVGYNIPYDIRVLKQAYHRQGVPFPKIEMCDIMSIYVDLFGAEPGVLKKRWLYPNGKCYYTGYRLIDAAHYLGVALPEEKQAHSALEDVDLSVLVLAKMMKKFPDLDFSKYCNKIYENPAYVVPDWQKLLDEGMKYYPFGTATGEPRVNERFTLYNK